MIYAILKIHFFPNVPLQKFTEKKIDNDKNLLFALKLDAKTR